MPSCSRRRCAQPFVLTLALALLAGCCTARPLPASAARADLPEVGEVSPRRTH